MKRRVFSCIKAFFISSCYVLGALVGGSVSGGSFQKTLFICALVISFLALLRTYVLEDMLIKMTTNNRPNNPNQESFKSFEHMNKDTLS